MEGRTQGFQAENCLPHHTTSLSSSPSASWCHGKWNTCNFPSVWCKRKYFWCLHSYCCCSWHWTSVSMGTLLALLLCSPMWNKLECTLYSCILFLSEPASTSAIWTTDQTTQASIRCPCMHQWAFAAHDFVVSSPPFLLWSTFERSPLTRALVLEMLWLNRLAITSWPLANSLKSWCLPIFSLSIKSSFRTKFSLGA